MSMWTMIFLIVMGGMAFAAWRHHHDVKMGVVRDEMGAPVRNIGREKELEKELTVLRERVKVLERIATDDRGARDLAHEIDQLRDERNQTGESK